MFWYTQCIRESRPRNTCRSIRRDRALAVRFPALQKICAQSAVRSLITAAGDITKFRWSNISRGTRSRCARYRSEPTNRPRRIQLCQSQIRQIISYQLIIICVCKCAQETIARNALRDIKKIISFIVMNIAYVFPKYFEKICQVFHVIYVVKYLRKRQFLLGNTSMFEYLSDYMSV